MAEMDNEQAKLILQAYRPGGEDAERSVLFRSSRTSPRRS